MKKLIKHCLIDDDYGYSYIIPFSEKKYFIHLKDTDEDRFNEVFYKYRTDEISYEGFIYTEGTDISGENN